MRPGCAKGNLTGRGRMSISFADHARIMVGSYSRIGFLLVGLVNLELPCFEEVSQNWCVSRLWTCTPGAF